MTTTELSYPLAAMCNGLFELSTIFFLANCRPFELSSGSVFLNRRGLETLLLGLKTLEKLKIYQKLHKELSIFKHKIYYRDDLPPNK